MFKNINYDQYNLNDNSIWKEWVLVSSTDKVSDD